MVQKIFNLFQSNRTFFSEDFLVGKFSLSKTGVSLHGLLSNISFINLNLHKNTFQTKYHPVKIKTMRKQIEVTKDKNERIRSRMTTVFYMNETN